MTIRLIIADDHALFRQGLAALVREQADWELLGEACDGEEAVRLAAEHQPDIAVLDVAMPGMTGIDAVPRIQAVSPSTRVVALSMYGDAHYQKRMFDAGALGYVLKNEAMADLVDAVRAALRGVQYVSPTIKQGSPDAALRSAEVDRQDLTPRELEVLRLMAQGQRTKEISATLDISVKTVETYRSRIMLKLGIDNVPGLVKFAIRAGIVSPET